MQVHFDCLESLINFPERVVLNKLKGPYRKGILAIIKVQCVCVYVQWNLSNEGTVCSPNHIELCTNLPLN